MANHQVSGKKSLYAPLQTQDSVLLDISSEIRNAIYDTICATATTVTVCYRTKRRISLVDHPLARTCRQLREEFSDVWTANAGTHATTIVCAIKNFDVGDISRMKAWFNALSPLEDEVQRGCMLKFHIDNNFERSVRQMARHSIQRSAGEAQVKFRFQAVFDQESLGISNVVRVMQVRHALPDPVQEAISVAIARYKSEQAEQKRARVAASRQTDFEDELAGERPAVWPA